MTATPYVLPRETRESSILVGNGTVGPYGPSAYKVFDTVDVKVFAKADGEEVFSDVTAGCTIAKVNPANAYDFFTVTFGASVPATTDWYHQARRTAERSVAVTKGGTIDSNQLEKELSKQASAQSELRRDVDRAVSVDRGTNPIKVKPGDAGDVAMFDAAGNLVPGPSASDIEADLAAANASAVAAAASASAAATARDAARKWATEAEDVGVNDGVNPAGFSAYNWMRKALGYAGSAMTYAAAAAASAASVALPNPGVANTFLQRNAGNTAYDPKTATEVRNALAAAVYVADRAAVKALDPTKDRAATTYGEGLGRNGTWLPYLTASLSADDVAAKALDTVEGIYFTSTANAAYTWIRSGDWRANGAPQAWFGVDAAAADNASAMQAGINTTARVGVVLKPHGGLFKLGSKMTCPIGARIVGPGQPLDRNGAFSPNSAYFHFNHTDHGFELAGTAAGSTEGPRLLKGFGTYRTQPVAGPGWAPTAMGFDINIKGIYGAEVRDIFLYNPTNGIQLVGDTSGAGSGCGRITIDNIRGQPLGIGLQVTHAYDVCYIDNIHWWPFYSFDANILAYMKATAFPFIFKRADNFDVGRLFAWGYRMGLYFENQASVGLDGILPPGGASLFHADAIGIDACGETALFVSTAVSGATFTIDSFYGGGATAMSESVVRVLGANVKGVIASLYGYNSNKSLVAVQVGTGNDLKIGNSRSVLIDVDASGDAEFSMLTGGGNTLTLMTKPITSATKVYGPIAGAIINTPDWDAYRSVLSADRAGADVATVQNLFNATEDEFTLAAATTYEFEEQFVISRAGGATSRTLSTLFGGTATFTDIHYVAEFSSAVGNVAAAKSDLEVKVATATVLTAASTSTTENIRVTLRGIMRINAGGTVIPQFQFSAIAGGVPTIAKGSYFRCKAIGSNTMVAQGPVS